jgi:glycosyltransferase involved in cell wall biosynthesis
MKNAVLLFSSLRHGGGKTFAEAFIHSVGANFVTVASIFDIEFTRTFAAVHNVGCAPFAGLAKAFDRDVVIFSNSQLSALVGSLLFPGRHYYVTHGFANGLRFTSGLRQQLWRLQTRIPGTRLVACGDSELNEIERLLGHTDAVYLIRNAVPPKISPAFIEMERFCKRALPLRLLYAGRICSQKGLDLLLTALCRQKQGSFHLTVVGNVQEREKDYAARIHNLLHKLGDAVHMRPPVEIDIEFLQQFDAIAFPSRFEGLPYTLLEAAVAGLPVITSDCAGNIDVAPDSSCCFQFTTENADALSSALADFLTAGSVDIHSRAVRLKNHVIQRFSSETFSNEYKKLLV